MSCTWAVECWSYFLASNDHSVFIWSCWHPGQMTWPFDSFRPPTPKGRQIKSEPCGGRARSAGANRTSWAIDVDIIDQYSMFIGMSRFIDWSWQRAEAEQPWMRNSTKKRKEKRTKTDFLFGQLLPVSSMLLVVSLPHYSRRSAAGRSCSMKRESAKWKAILSLVACPTWLTGGRKCWAVCSQGE